MSKVTFFLLMGLLSMAAAATIETEPAKAAPETVADAAAVEDMDGAASTIDSANDMDAEGTVIVPNNAVQENHVGLYNTRTCSPLGTSVVNLNQCCSVAAGPLDSTNIKKCCLPIGSVCNEAPNACCHSRQNVCLESSPGSSILTCQRVSVQVLPTNPSLSIPINGYNSLSGNLVLNNNNNALLSNVRVATPLNVAGQSQILDNVGDVISVSNLNNNGYGLNNVNLNNNGYGLNAVNLNSGLGLNNINLNAANLNSGLGLNNVNLNAVNLNNANNGYGLNNVNLNSAYDVNNNYGLDNGYNSNLNINNNNNNYGSSSGYGYAAGAAAAGA